MRWIAATALLSAVAGCGSSGAEKLPVACTQGPGAVVKALAAAPRAVTIGGTPISRCFNRDARGQDVQIVGTNLLAAAEELAAGRRGLELGYLIGAARRGAKRNGLGDELVRRLQQEPTGALIHSADYQRGLRAGLSTG
jgi:hypothetical protein